MKITNLLKKNKDITYELVRKSIKSQYRNSCLGAVWTVLNPLLNMLVMWVVFRQFFGRNDPLYSIYLLTGNIIFQALRTSTSTSLTSIVNNRGLITKVKIDKYLFPMSSTLSSLVNLAFSMISLIIIMAFMAIFNGYNIFGYQFLFMFFMIPALLLFEYGISLFLSALYVFFRDIKQLYSVILTLWQYLTPIFYKVDSTFSSGSVGATIIKLNPMYYFVTYFRECMYACQYNGTGCPSFKILGILYLVGVVSIIIGYAVYKPLEKHFITNI